MLEPLSIFCTTFVTGISSSHASNASATSSNSSRYLLHNFWAAHGGTSLKAVIAKLSTWLKATKGRPCLNARLNYFSSCGFVHIYSHSYLLLILLLLLLLLLPLLLLLYTK